MKVLIEGTNEEIRAFLGNDRKWVETVIGEAREMKSCGCDPDNYCNHDLIALEKEKKKLEEEIEKLKAQKFPEEAKELSKLCADLQNKNFELFKENSSLIACRDACVEWRKNYKFKRESLSEDGRAIWDATEPFMPKEAPNANG